MEINLTTINRLTKWRTLLSSNSNENKNTKQAKSSDLQNTLKGIEETVLNPSSIISGIKHISEQNSTENESGQQTDRGPTVVCQSDEWAFLSLFVEAARANQTQEDLDIFLLRTIGIEEQSTRQSICEFYGRLQPRLARQLVQIGTHLKHVVDVKCRMDYQVTNTINGKACDGDPTYIVELTCQNPNKVVVEQINLSCTLFELQDLVNQLKDAKRMCESNAATLDKRKDNDRPVITLYPSKTQR
jgi:hypothetical protein